MTVYNELRGKIVEAGLTQKSVAEKIGISEHALGNKLNGKRDFKLGEILAIAELLRIEHPVADVFLP